MSQVYPLEEALGLLVVSRDAVLAHVIERDHERRGVKRLDNIELGPQLAPSCPASVSSSVTQSRCVIHPVGIEIRVGIKLIWVIELLDIDVVEVAGFVGRRGRPRGLPHKRRASELVGGGHFDGVLAHCTLESSAIPIQRLHILGFALRAEAALSVGATRLRTATARQTYTITIDIDRAVTAVDDLPAGPAMA